MKKGLISLLMLAAVLATFPLRAEVLVLVHGYLSGAQTWDKSGITMALQRDGWRRGGTYVGVPAGVRLMPIAGVQADHSFYAVDFPSEAPILIQARLLNKVLSAINTSHPDESIVLVGHSAGGVVARAALVLGGAQHVKALMTIASPHLGTSRAEEALDIADIPFPLSMMTDFLGGDTYNTLMRSRSLYADLVRPRPGTFLYWLDGQSHPDIKYFSIVRGHTPAGWGDNIVPAYSQDMNNVPALRGRSARVVIPASHGLAPVDGSIIVNLLDGLG